MTHADERQPDVDVVVVGAGFAGLYLLHRLRNLGFAAQVIEAADGVGGTWYWNRYPGARCDVQSVDYSYSFDPALEAEWEWSEKYATQPEILRYLNHVADRFDLRRDITFGTRVDRATWREDQGWWEIVTDHGATIRTRFYVMATGCLSVPKEIDIDGVDRFRGEKLLTGRWPHEPVDLRNRRVAVIGTGSSAIQAIPIIAGEAESLTVFQRTPNFTFPAHNGPIPAVKLAQIEGRRDDYRAEARWSPSGVPFQPSTVGALQVSDEERRLRYEEAWETGELFPIYGAFADIMVNEEANETLCEFVRNKIRSIVEDPDTAERLCPRDHPIGSKRICLDSGYYATYNLPHVKLVDVRDEPIVTVTEEGIDTERASYEFDTIVFATGFDAMTGPIVGVDIVGRDGVELADKWADGPRTYLGLTVAGFPNFFAVTGPGSPSVLSNMVVSIEQHAEWITDALEHMRRHGFDRIEATEGAEDAWVDYVNAGADMTLFPKANSWYMGANVPDKPRVFLAFAAGVGPYRRACNDVAERGYLGFELTGPERTSTNDGVVRPLQPDVTELLYQMSLLDLPPIESLSPDEARAFMAAAGAQSPPGPALGEVVDGVLCGGAGDLPYRLYRPPTPGPHPVVAYFHGGGWVLGDLDSDDAFCRDLCLRSGAILVSVNYRHAPEHRFPAAVEDADAATRWIAENAEELGGVAGGIVVCGWSAGANLAAVSCILARDDGASHIVGQVLVNPVTDSDLCRASYAENADGFILTRPLMEWFWDHYADPEDRRDPRAAPLRAPDLSNLPPALVVTSQFDPLHDEGIAYAEALDAAGVRADLLDVQGHIHTSFTAVGVILSGAATRARVAAAIRQMLAESVAV